MHKTCIQCDKLLPYQEFYFRKDINKHRNNCKSCVNKNSKKRREGANREKILQQKRNYYTNNKEQILAKQKTKRARAPKKIPQHLLISQKEKEIQHLLTHKLCFRCNQVHTIDRFHFNKNKEKYDNTCKSCINDSQKIKKSQNRLYKLKAQLRSNFSNYVKGKRSFKTIEYVGCSWEFLKNYLESTFEENYGLPRNWISSFSCHIDHIIPLSSAKSIEDVYKLYHYTNLQYLLSHDNISKKDKLDWKL